VDSWRALSLPKKVIVVVGALVLLSVATSGGGNKSAETQTSPSSRSVASTAAPSTPTAAAATTVPPPSASPSPDRRWIPGLTNLDVTGNLEASPRNMNCLRVPEFDSPTGRRSGWSCRSTVGGIITLRVDTVSASEVQVERVLAAVAVSAGTVSQADDAARSFLGYVATLPYQGADPVAARHWVESNVTSTSSTIPRATFGGAAFSVGKSLIAGTPYYTLEMRSLGFPSP
jgi:hypothetical protein